MTRISTLDTMVARAPEHEEFYGDHLITIMKEHGTGTFYRYYIDGRSGCGYSTVGTAVTAAQKRIDRNAE